MPLTAGSRLGPYEIVAVIGTGGMGVVYRAHDLRLKRDVALKVLPPELARDAGRVLRFEQESLAAAALSHPNVLSVFDVGIDESGPYVVSELLEGETLGAALLRGALPHRVALDVATQTARGMAAAHQRGIVHRDLKPENIFVTTDGRVKILDFGLAKLTESIGALPHAVTAVATIPGTVLGTAGYMSPEQVRGEATDFRTDIFAFGAVLYEMLSGARAFGGDSAVETMTAILKDRASRTAAGNRPSRPRSHRPPVPREEPGAAVPVGRRPRLRPRDACRRRPRRCRPCPRPRRGGDGGFPSPPRRRLSRRASPSARLPRAGPPRPQRPPASGP